MNKIKTLNLPSKEISALLDFKKIIQKEFENEVKEIRLFGSKARRNWKKDSDVDVLIVLKNVTEARLNFIYDTVMFLCGKYSVYLSVKVFSKKEFKYYQSIPTRFVQNVLSEGIKI